MVFRFFILSDEADHFKREIKIDSDATFLDFYKAIIACTGFSNKEISSFFICDDNWRKKQEITLVEMDTDSDQDSYIMEETLLSDFLEDEKQKLLFVFDYLNDRALYIELSEIITGKGLKKAQCILSEGEPPVQFLSFEDEKIEMATSNVGESFYGDESFDMDELDREGFDGLDDLPVESDEGDLY